MPQRARSLSSCIQSVFSKRRDLSGFQNAGGFRISFGLSTMFMPTCGMQARSNHASSSGPSLALAVESLISSASPRLSFSSLPTAIYPASNRSRRPCGRIWSPDTARCHRGRGGYPEHCASATAVALPPAFCRRPAAHMEFINRGKQLGRICIAVAPRFLKPSGEQPGSVFRGCNGARSVRLSGR